METGSDIGIYKITNIITEMSYIGQSRHLNSRLTRHKNGQGVQLISKSIRKHGSDNFIFEILEECDIESLNEKEQYWIEKFECMSPNGYNLTSGGGQNIIVSEETKKKMSLAQTGKIITDSTKEKLSLINTGKPLTEETKQKISVGCKNMSPESKQKRRDSLIGRPVSNETRLKISKSNTGRKASKEACENISKALTGKTLTEEHKANVSKSLLGRKTPWQSKKIIDSNGIVYDDAKDAGNKLNISHTTIRNICTGRRKDQYVEGLTFKYNKEE